MTLNSLLIVRSQQDLLNVTDIEIWNVQLFKARVTVTLVNLMNCFGLQTPGELRLFSMFISLVYLATNIMPGIYWLPEWLMANTVLKTYRYINPVLATNVPWNRYYLN